jgi:hypothetical protein
MRRKMMKKILSVFLGLSLIIALSGVAFAAEKVVQLIIPGCRPCGAASRINKIMKKIDGVKKHENREQDLLVITFDDEKTTLGVIVDELKKGKFAVTGEPIYLK